MNISTDGDWRIHLEQVWLLGENLASLVDDVDGLLLGEASLAVEVLLQEGEIWLGWIDLGEELLVGWYAHGWCLDICVAVSILYLIEVGRQCAPLQTLSMVLTWLPSSMVCKVKSISGAGFFSLKARRALSIWAWPAFAPGAAAPVPSCSLIVAVL